MRPLQVGDEHEQAQQGLLTGQSGGLGFTAGAGDHELAHALDGLILGRVLAATGAQGPEGARDFDADGEGATFRTPEEGVGLRVGLAGEALAGQGGEVLV